MRAARIIAAGLSRFVILAAAYFGSVAPASFLSTIPITRFDYFSDDHWAWNPGYWLTPGHLILILFFPAMAIARQFLTRRDAVIAIVIGWGIPVLFLVAIQLLTRDLLTAGVLPPRETTASFAAGMAAAEFLLWRGLSHRGPALRDAPLAAGLFAVLFNVLTYDLDPDLAGARVFLQTAIYVVGAGVIGLAVKPLVRR